ncbi:uncharacterized protein BP5553_05845 [Venustampulla echinocandica]|uniref:Ran-binding-domain-containing protein n=1 Tax=Venustampulla echinocandica TaxID=2656787 RepID=A0A370TLT9_9HELO|nr:uncharacterized protein BP5553_05845 [Venustampulla echinocandica]RDL36493.1 hypothetical protein BP5553_05845 [Venustampulla echinocandica]
MDAFLSKITQHAMNYAIRSGIGITASFAISQTSRLLKTVDDNGDYQELQSLQERLDSKIRIISPAIDLIELISARGNTTLESAVTLAKALRWDIQSLGIRLEKAAAAEEISRKKSGRAKSRAAHEVEIRYIVQDIRKLLIRIEDAVPLINLAIATSGASLSTRLPSTVSPSRLLQASTFLTLGDTRYCENPAVPAQVGPVFTLSLYMLYSGHAPVGRKEKYKGEEQEPDMAKGRKTNRGPTWKEVVHKARVKLLRVPLDFTDPASLDSHTESYGGEQTITSDEGRTTEFAYQLEFIEDLDDDRVHTFDDNEPQPGPYGGVQLAGIRESLPIHQIGRIFYADTGKILNIRSQHETNNPVLLLKRDVDALPPRKLMQESEKSYQWYEDPEDAHAPYLLHDSDSDSQNDIDRQIQRESSVALLEQAAADNQPPEEESRAWRFPQDLDPEWIALEVYNEPEEFNSDDEQEPTEGSTYTSRQPSLSAEAESPIDKSLAEKLEAINLSQDPPSPTPTPSPKPTPPPAGLTDPITEPPFTKSTAAAPPTPFGPIRSSLSLLEMLIRLASLQQFQQASHLSIPDEFLVFFLEESSSTGLGGADDRRKARNAAREKVGFDPYDETPMKRPGEEYTGGDNQWDSAPARSTYTEYERSPNYYDNRGFRNTTPSGWTPPPRLGGSGRAPGTPEPRLPHNRDLSSTRPAQEIQDIPPSSPVSPYRPVRKLTRQLQRVKQSAAVASPLGRGMSVETDSTLGTSPGSPTLVERAEMMHKRVHAERGTESE